MLRPKISSTSKKQLLDFFSSNKTMELSQNKRDLIAVIGTTGVGKSQLAVELALSLAKLAKGKGPEVRRGGIPSKGEIINADSMQVYKGLDTITNKMTKAEMKDVPHHLMGFLTPGEDYRVGGFQSDALSRVSLASFLRAALTNCVLRLLKYMPKIDSQ
jgi:Mrp family chromosome partitioning ATPase